MAFERDEKVDPWHHLHKPMSDDVLNDYNASNVEMIKTFLTTINQC